MSLRKYHEKRNFKVTKEPYGRLLKKQAKLQYLIQEHAASHLHYDFRLELNGVLLSWAVPKGPCLDPQVKRLAVHVEDHPLDYGSFEGLIPAGQYGGGIVLLWDTGTWEPDEANVQAAYKGGHLSFTLKGKKLKGSWKLIQIKKDPKHWLLMKVDDRYAKGADYNILEKKPKSVKSQYKLQQLSQKLNGSPHTLKPTSKKKLSKKSKDPLPKTIYPALATLINQLPKGKGWLHVMVIVF